MIIFVRLNGIYEFCSWQKKKKIKISKHENALTTSFINTIKIKITFYFKKLFFIKRIRNVLFFVHITSVYIKKSSA